VNATVILTLLQALIAGLAVTGAFAIGRRLERDAQHRKARRYHAALVRPVASIAPDEYETDRLILRGYQQEVWGDLR
jgi:hypothetical protein